MRIGINITPGEMAKSNPVGNGRTEPNQSPYLPPPVGRISFSLNPFSMLVSIFRILFDVFRCKWLALKSKERFICIVA